MTTRSSIFLGGVITLALLADGVFNDAKGTVFVLRHLLDRLHWVAFWR